MIYGSAEEFRDFYASSLGQIVRRILSRHLRVLWPDLRMMRVLGVGFATPFLRPLLGEAERVIAVMPASQGATIWPPEKPGLVTLSDEASLPFPDCSYDRILLCHALEHTESARTLMRELWRILSDDGILLAMVPNRRGIWARLEHTPFGSGRPFSTGQVKQLLEDTLFTPTKTHPALFIPPLQLRILSSWGPPIETIGKRWFPSFSGVLLAEARKQIYAINPNRKQIQARRHYIPITDSMSVPGSVPGSTHGANPENRLHIPPQGYKKQS